jgi:ribosomal-protein-alanine N-acetyltransferase
VIGETRTTERLRLEPIGPQHADVLLHMHQDIGVIEWFGVWSRGDVEQRIAVAVRGWRERGVEKWIAYERATDEPVGRGGGSFLTIEGREQFEIGWTLHDRHRGRGLATEIGRATLDMAFAELGLHRAIAFTEPENQRSRAVMERLGMHDPRLVTHDDTTFVLYSIRGDDHVGSSDPPTSESATGRLTSGP